jgi:hypothetical protein
MSEGSYQEGIADPPAPEPTLEEQLRQVLASPKAIPRHKHLKLMSMLDNMLVLQTKKLVTLYNLRDALQAEFIRKGGW